MNKTLYVKDEDSQIWDKARELTSDKLSQFIMEKLRAFITAEEARKGGFERIQLHFIEDDLPVAKAFNGRWLIKPDELFEIEFDIDDYEGLELGESPSPYHYGVAQTVKGKFVFFGFTDFDGRDAYSFKDGRLLVFGSIPEAMKSIRANVVAETVRRLGIEVQELDI